MFEYGFVENQDFTPILEKSTRDCPSIDCTLEIVMIQRSEKGRKARQYFITCKKELRQNPQYQILPAEIQQILLKMDFLEKETEKNHQFSKNWCFFLCFLRMKPITTILF